MTTPEDGVAVSVRLDDELADTKMAALRAQATQTAPVFAAMGEDCYRAWFEEENFSVPKVPGSGPDGVDAAEGLEGVVATLGV